MAAKMEAGTDCACAHGGREAGRQGGREAGRQGGREKKGRTERKMMRLPSGHLSHRAF